VELGSAGTITIIGAPAMALGVTAIGGGAALGIHGASNLGKDLHQLHWNNQASGSGGSTAEKATTPEEKSPELRWEPSPKHGPTQRGRAAPEPADPEGSLQRSVPLGPNTTRRVSADPANTEFSVFDETHPGTGIYHGHARSWDQLNQQQKNALIRGGLADRKGRILVQE
jgi:hypothetical protein